MSKELILKNVRLAWWQGFKAKAFAGTRDDGSANEPRYSGRYYIEPKSANAKLIDAAILQVANEAWEKKAAQILSVIRTDKQKFCYFESTWCNGEGDPYDGAEGLFHLNSGQAETKGAPLVIGPTGMKGMNLPAIDKDGRGWTPADSAGMQFPILTAKDGRPYSGCFVNVKLNCWSQDNSSGKAVRFSILTVQFAGHGDAFGGGAPATAEGMESTEDGIAADDLA